MSAIVKAVALAGVCGGTYAALTPSFKAPGEQAAIEERYQYTRAADGATIYVVSSPYYARHLEKDEALQNFIRETKPDTVVIQTDPANQVSASDDYYPTAGSRFNQFSAFSEYWLNIVRERTSELGLRLNYGAVAAREAAEEVGANVVFEDRPEKVTTGHIPFWRALDVVPRLFAAKEYVGKRVDDMEQIDRAWYVGDRPGLRQAILKYSDIDASFPGMTEAALGPHVYNKFVREPAQYFAAKLNSPDSAPGKTIVAVTGSTASKAAVRQGLDENVNINALNKGPNVVLANLGTLTLAGLVASAVLISRAGSRPTAYWFKHTMKRVKGGSSPLLRKLENQYPGLNKKSA